MMSEYERLITSLSNAIKIAYHGSSQVSCPHCNYVMELPVLPLTPIVVCQCENCKGYVLPFAGQLLGLPAGVIESGSDPDIRWAIEQVIMKALYAGVKQLLRYRVPVESEEEGGGNIPDSFDDLEKLWSSDEPE